MEPGKAGPGHLARFGFTDNERTGAMAGPGGLRLWDPVARRPADDDAAAVLDTLYFAADPDLALFQLHRLVEAAGEDVRTAVLTDRTLRRRLIGVLGVSATLGDLLVANPGLDEIEVNPLRLTHDGLVALDAVIISKEADDAHPHQ